MTTEQALEPIPYDEMRRLCGLPDVSAYIARRDVAQAWDGIASAFIAFGEVVFLSYGEIEKAMEPIRKFAAAAARKPTHVPPMWAVDPGRSRRTRNRATDIRTPFR